MPKVPVQEIFSRGLVTSRPPHMLSSGELVRAGHTVYRENNPCIVRAPDHGLYSPDDLSTLLPSSTVTGLLAVNLDREDAPDQIIAKVGSDLLISQVTGADGNTFLPITSPGKVNVEVGLTPYFSATFNPNNTTVLCPSTGLWDLEARIGRAVASQVACPAQDNYVIIGINYFNNHVASIVLNAPPKVAVQTTELMYFAPPVYIVDNEALFYDNSVGFTGVVVSNNVTDTSISIISTHNSPNYVEVNNDPLAGGDVKNHYVGACIGRKVKLSGGAHNGQSYYVNWITHYLSGDNLGYVNRLYLDGAVFVGNPGAVTVTMEPFTQNVVITAVNGVIDNLPIKSYNHCYLNCFLPRGSYEIVFTGGLGKKLIQSSTPIDGLSWDGTAFIWDGVSPVNRIVYVPRKHFHESFDAAPAPIYRAVSLDPVVSPPKVDVIAGSWSPFLGDAQYWFMITEAFIPSTSGTLYDENFTATKDPVESAYTARSSSDASSGNTINTNTNTSYAQKIRIGTPIEGVITAHATQCFELTFPAPVNNGQNGKISTHWNIYMAQGVKITNNNSQIDPTPPPPSSFHRILTVPILTRTGGQKQVLQDKREIYKVAVKNIKKPVTASSFPRVAYSRGPSLYEPIIGGIYNAPQVDFELSNSDAGKTTLGLSGPTAGKRVFGIELKTRVFAGDFDIQGRALPGSIVFEIRTRLQSGAVKKEEINPQSAKNLQLGGAGDMWGLDSTSLDLATLAVRVTGGTPSRSWAIKTPLYAMDPRLDSPPNPDTVLVENDATYGVEEPLLTGVQTSQFTYWTQAKQFLFNRDPLDGQSPKVYKVYPDINVWLHLTGTTINLDGPIYKTVIYEEAASGVAIADPAMLPPPIASIGDTFNGALVLNDVSAPSFIRYSMPDRPEYFPGPYRMRMGTKRRGKITAIKKFKGVLIVGMERAIKRVNYLPTENDTDFLGQIGRAHEDVSESHGIVGPNAVAEFELPGVGAMLAYVSTIGLRVTDGSTTKALNTDVLLKDYVHPDHWEKCILKAYPSQKWLVLYYVPKEASHGRLTRSFVFSFSEDHLKGSMTLELVNQPSLTGPLSCTGPNDCFVVDATDAIIQSSPVVITTDGKYVYVEDSPASSVKVKTAAGNDDETLVDRINAPDIKSRDIFPAGPTQDANISGIYILHETKGSHFIRTDGTSTKGNTTLSFTSPVGSHVPVVGERVIHGGWDNVVTVLQVVDNYNIIVSAPAVRSVTTDAVYDTGNIMVRINAGQLGEDMVPILTEYRSTTVGVNQTFLMDGTANRFSVEISKVENPNTGFLMDLNEEMSIAGISYHVGGAGDAGLHVN